MVEYTKDANPITQDMFKTIEMVENIIKNNFGTHVGDAVHGRIQDALSRVVERGGKLGKHSEFRSNITGYKGSELFMTREERGEAFKMAIQSSVNEYAGGLRNMIITSKTDMMLQNNPDDVVLQSMVTASKGRTENALDRADTLMRNSWDRAVLALSGQIKANNKWSFDRVQGNLLEVFYLFKLMSKAIFPINQVFASLQSIRQMSVEGGFFKPYIAMGKGLAKLATGDAELKNQLFEVSTKTNTFEPQFIEALHLSDKDNKVWDGIKTYALFNKVNESADSISRVIAFSSAYSMFRDMGLSESAAQTRAIEVANLSMVPYGKTETAPGFTKMGQIGQAMRPLQTFGQAQLGNWIADFRHMKATDAKTWAPMINYHLVSTMLAGAVSLLFVQEYEMMRKWLNAEFPKYFDLPSVFDIIKADMSFLDRVVKTEEDTKEALKIITQYGAPALSGIDLASSSRSNETLFTVMAAAISGSKAWYEMLPALEATRKGAIGLASVPAMFGDKKSAETRQAITDVAPAGHIGYGLKEAFGVNTTRQALPEGGYRNTDQLAGGSDNDAIKTRTTADIVAGYMGGKSTDERIVSDTSRLETERSKNLTEIRKTLVNKFMDTGNQEFIKRLAQTGLTPEQIESMLKSKGFKRGAGVGVRSLIDASGQPISTVDEAKRADAYKRAGMYKEGRM